MTFTNKSKTDLERIIQELFGILNKTNVTNIDIAKDEYLIKDSYYSEEVLNNLEENYPTLCNEWNYEKNNKLLPKQFSKYSNQIIWWKCKQGHEWRASIAHRTMRNDKCPFCAGKKILPGFNDLATTSPTLLKEWNYQKNTINPNSVSKSSSRKVWWICSKGHEWEATINNRDRGKGCPYCSGNRACKDNCISSLFPHLEKEWDYEKNYPLIPQNITIGSSRKVWWKCPNCKNTWQASVASRTKLKTGCPQCWQKKRGQSHKKRVTNIDTGEVFNSIKDANIRYGINPSNISECCLGRRNMAGGFRWKYTDSK